MTKDLGHSLGVAEVVPSVLETIARVGRRVLHGLMPH